MLHPPREKLHGRRHITHLHLSAEPSGTEFHVTNLHMVAKAFSNPPTPPRDIRVKEWHDGIAKHLIQIDKLVESGMPVLGGGDYNRRLSRHPALGSEVGGRDVMYAVDPRSIDLLWFVDGDQERWGLRSKQVFERNSDHDARLANVVLSTNGSGLSSAASFFIPGNGHNPSVNGHPKGPKGKGPKAKGPKGGPKAEPEAEAKST